MILKEIDMNKKEKNTTKEEKVMNKKLIKCFVLGAALLIGVIIIGTQDKGTTPPQPSSEKATVSQKEVKSDVQVKRSRASLKDQLDLTEEQRELMKQIKADGRKEIEPLIAEINALRDKMEAVRAKNNEEFEKILTPEQRAKLAEIRDQEDREEQLKAEMNRKIRDFYKRKYSGQVEEE